MNDRRREAPILYSATDRAWFDAQVPDSPFRREAARTIAHLNEVLAEPVRVKPTLEVALVDAMEQEVKQAKQTANYWQVKAREEYNALRVTERQVRRLVRQVQVWSSTAMVAVVALGLLAWVHWR